MNQKWMEVQTDGAVTDKDSGMNATKQLLELLMLVFSVTRPLLFPLGSAMSIKWSITIYIPKTTGIDIPVLVFLSLTRQCLNS